MAGTLISFEGIDGTGKSTQAKMLRAWLKADHNIGAILTREPGGTMLGAHVRDDLLFNIPSMSTEAETLLFLADRAEHFEKLVIPQLQEDKIVITDRCIDSTLVYQGYSKEFNVDLIEHINAVITQGRSPDITILLDMPPIESLKRKENNLDRMEDIHLLKKARDAYLRIAAKNPARIATIDARADKYAIHECITQLVWDRIQGEKKL